MMRSDRMTRSDTVKRSDDNNNSEDVMRSDDTNRSDSTKKRSRVENEEDSSHKRRIRPCRTPGCTQEETHLGNHTVEHTTSNKPLLTVRYDGDAVKVSHRVNCWEVLKKSLEAGKILPAVYLDGETAGCTRFLQASLQEWRVHNKREGDEAVTDTALLRPCNCSSGTAAFIKTATNVDCVVGDICEVVANADANTYSVVWYDMTGRDVNFERGVHASQYTMITVNTRCYIPDDVLRELAHRCSNLPNCYLVNKGVYKSSVGKSLNMVYVWFERKDTKGARCASSVPWTVPVIGPERDSLDYASDWLGVPLKVPLTRWTSCGVQFDVEGFVVIDECLIATVVDVRKRDTLVLKYQMKGGRMISDQRQIENSMPVVTPSVAREWLMTPGVRLGEDEREGGREDDVGANPGEAATRGLDEHEHMTETTGLRVARPSFERDDEFTTDSIINSGSDYDDSPAVTIDWEPRRTGVNDFQYGIDDARARLQALMKDPTHDVLRVKMDRDEAFTGTWSGPKDVFGTIKQVLYCKRYVALVQFDGEDFLSSVTCSSFMLSSTVWLWHHPCVRDDSLPTPTGDKHVRSMTRAVRLVKETIRLLGSENMRGKCILTLDGNGENRRAFEGALDAAHVPVSYRPTVITLELNPEVAFANALRFGREFVRFCDGDANIRRNNNVVNGIERAIAIDGHCALSEHEKRNCVALYLDYCGGPPKRFDFDLLYRNLPQLAVCGVTVAKRRPDMLLDDLLLHAAPPIKTFERVEIYNHTKVVCALYARKVDARHENPVKQYESDALKSICLDYTTDHTDEEDECGGEPGWEAEGEEGGENYVEEECEDDEANKLDAPQAMECAPCESDTTTIEIGMDAFQTGQQARLEDELLCDAASATTELASSDGSDFYGEESRDDIDDAIHLLRDVPSVNLAELGEKGWFTVKKFVRSLVYALDKPSRKTVDEVLAWFYEIKRVLNDMKGSTTTSAPRAEAVESHEHTRREEVVGAPTPVHRRQKFAMFRLACAMNKLGMFKDADPRVLECLPTSVTSAVAIPRDDTDPVHMLKIMGPKFNYRAEHVTLVALVWILFKDVETHLLRMHDTERICGASCDGPMKMHQFHNITLKKYIRKLFKADDFIQTLKPWYAYHVEHLQVTGGDIYEKLFVDLPNDYHESNRLFIDVCTYLVTCSSVRPGAGPLVGMPCPTSWIPPKNRNETSRRPLNFESSERWFPPLVSAGWRFE